MIRTHDAGSLRSTDVGSEVTLAGWVARRRDHGGVAFIDLREASGVVQVVIRDEAVAHNLRNEYCLKVTGTVSLRPEGNQNANLPTGDIEVSANGARIYYGELNDDYSVVGGPSSSPPREFDRPQTGSDQGQVSNTYDGKGGVAIGSFFRRLTFAIYYRERNFLLSNAVNDDSKVLYVRNPRERVEKAAPFLKVDGDPYPAVINGRVTWILDGYTTSDSYPYSERMQLGQAA